jgi:hypothetical protein
MPRPARRMFVKDGALLAAQLRGWAADSKLSQIIVSHGEVIKYDPAGVLENVAKTFD